MDGGHEEAGELDLARVAVHGQYHPAAGLDDSRQLADAVWRVGEQHHAELRSGDVEALVVELERRTVAFAPSAPSRGGDQADSAPGEAALRESGMGWTFIRPNGFCENSLRDAPLIKEQGRFYSPLGNARVSWVAVRDLAAIAFAALTEPGHEGAAHTVTGPVALSHGDCAAALAEASGREISYVEVPDQAAREAMAGSGIPGPYADALIELFEWYRQGNAEVVSGDVERVLGRPATTYADWAREHADAFR